MLMLSLQFFLRVLPRVFFEGSLMSLFMNLFFWRVFGLIGLFLQLFHGFLIFLLKVFADLLDDAIEGVVQIRFLAFFNVHVLYVLNKRILYFSRSIGINHHYKILHQSLSIMKILSSLIINYPGIMKFAKPSEIHRNLIIEAHQLRRLIEVLQIFMMVQHLDETFNQFPINVHSVFVEAIVKIISEFLVLSLSIGRVGQVILVEWMLEYILWLDCVNRPTSHLIIIKLQILFLNV